jgi:hypothetical protein
MMLVANTVADGRSGGSNVSFGDGCRQKINPRNNETAFINLAICSGIQHMLIRNAKAGLQGAGYYYQFPKDMAGQSPILELVQIPNLAN